MLIKKSYEKDEIVCFKMVNGDEVIGKIASVTDDGWTITKPCTVLPSSQGLGLVQSLFSADINTEVEITKQHVMIHAPVIKQVQDHYIQTTTGIKTVSKGSIIT